MSGCWIFGLECSEVPPFAAKPPGVVLLEPKLRPLLGNTDTMREPESSTASRNIGPRLAPPAEAEILWVARDVTA